MTKRIFFTLFTSLLITQAMAQSAEDIVKNIRKQFNEVTSLENTKQSSGCQSGSSKTKRLIMGSNMSFPQSTTKCSYPGGYTIITSKFEDWEFQASVKYYFRNGQLFFVYTNESDVASANEYRTYYNNGKVIRILQRILISPDTDYPSKENKDITYSQDASFIINFNRDRLSQANNMIK